MRENLEYQFDERTEDQSLEQLHQKEPDYTRPLLEVPPERKQVLLEKLSFLYGAERAENCYLELERILRVYFAHKTPEMIREQTCVEAPERFSEKDVILITYGDLLQSPGKKPLTALGDFLDIYMNGAVNTVHVLPFFPYSSDRGFSIIDFEEVNPELGSWDEIEQLGLRFRLMFDGVFNHISAKSRWFQEFLNGNPEYRDYFINFSTRAAIEEENMKLILRPRTSDLLTDFHTLDGVKYLWTTFSPDQVDLNFKNEKVLLRVIEILLAYVRHGAEIIRLDAVTYMWVEMGTRCASLEETHMLVQFLRAVLDTVAPQVALITETNVPHEENVSYFGNGSDEAQMVYNFALPPLTLLAFLSGDCTRLSQWASTLEKPSETTTYFNFLDSHDGVGLLAVRDILDPGEIDLLTRKVEEHGGFISYKTNGDGSQSPYEMNITWYSALNREDDDEPLDRKVERFLASRAVALVLEGVPGIYLPSLFGSPNDRESVLQGEENRSINRKTIDEHALFKKLSDPDSSVYKLADRFRHIIEKRVECPAFHPNSSQLVFTDNSAVFSLLRATPDGKERVLALINVTSREQAYTVPLGELGAVARGWHDRITETGYRFYGGHVEVILEPYQIMWLSPES